MINKLPNSKKFREFIKNKEYCFVLFKILSIYSWVECWIISKKISLTPPKFFIKFAYYYYYDMTHDDELNMMQFTEYLYNNVDWPRMYIFSFFSEFYMLDKPRMSFFRKTFEMDKSLKIKFLNHVFIFPKNITKKNDIHWLLMSYKSNGNPIDEELHKYSLISVKYDGFFLKYLDKFKMQVEWNHNIEKNGTWNKKILPIIDYWSRAVIDLGRRFLDRQPVKEILANDPYKKWIWFCYTVYGTRELLKIALKPTDLYDYEEKRKI